MVKSPFSYGNPLLFCRLFNTNIIVMFNNYSQVDKSIKTFTCRKVKVFLRE